jgi:RNA-directed DNA polymerase
MTKEELINYDQLWDSYLKCRRGVSWKPSTKHYILNAIEETSRMHRKLQNGTWQNSHARPIHIAYPKPREGLSIPFKDRIYQRSINDNELYPKATNSFILDNCACQIGKGPDFARSRLRQFLWNYYSHYGNNGIITQIDIHGYYANMEHDLVKDVFQEYLDPDVHQMTSDILDTQYSGDTGYCPGSQMVQIAGISVLNHIDHFIKEQLHVKYYIRYMDDFLMLNRSKEKATSDLERIIAKLKELGFDTNPTKTKIIPLSGGFSFLGFDYVVTNTGKIIATINSDNLKHAKKKLYRISQLVKKGQMTRKKADEMFESWKAHASHGKCYKLFKYIDSYYNSLWED